MKANRSPQGALHAKISQDDAGSSGAVLLYSRVPGRSLHLGLSLVEMAGVTREEGVGTGGRVFQRMEQNVRRQIVKSNRGSVGT